MHFVENRKEKKIQTPVQRHPKGGLKEVHYVGVGVAVVVVVVMMAKPFCSQVL